MTPQPLGKRNRVFVPLELGSMLRAPHGWTNEMRRREGYPERGNRGGQLHLGFWRSLVLALAIYGPMIVGAVLGGRAWGWWPGAGVGAVLGLIAQWGLMMLAVPIVGLVRRRKP